MRTLAPKHPRYLARIAALAALASFIAPFLAIDSVKIALAAPTELPVSFTKASGYHDHRGPSLTASRDTAIVAGDWSMSVGTLAHEEEQREPLDLSTFEPKPATTKIKKRDDNTGKSAAIKGPKANLDEASGPPGQSMSVYVMANDEPMDDSVPLDPSSLKLLDRDSNLTDEITVPGEGIYTIDRSDTSNPPIVFTPEPGFAGTAEPVRYMIRDINGTEAQSTLTCTATEASGPE